MKYAEKSDTFEKFVERLNNSALAEFADDQPSRTDLATATIVGLPRSGTTLLMQLLAKSRLCGYPSNLMALYWKTPHVGAQLQLHFQRTQEQPETGLESFAGRTADPLEPHEFGYFWRNALGHSGNTLDHERSPIQAQELQRELDLINSVFDKPTVHKNLLAPAHLDYFKNELSRQKLLHIERHPLDVAISLLVLRRRISMLPRDWFGPVPTSDEKRFADDVDMVAYQVATLIKAYEAYGLGESPIVKRVSYKQLCLQTRRTIVEICDFIGAPNAESACSHIPESLEPSTQKNHLTKNEIDRLVDGLESGGVHL